MESSSRKISRSQELIGAVAALFMLSVCSAEDFFGQKPTGLEAQSILDNLSKIEPRPEPNIPIPEVYRQPPMIFEQVVGGKTEFKLLYFCRHHTSDTLKTIIHDQFASTLFDAKGKSTRKADYTVTSNPATNQLIVRCPAKEDVEAVLQTLQGIDVPPIQVKIDCIISEVYADKTVDWQTSLLIEELFGEDIWAGPAGRPFGMAVTDLIEEATTLPAFPGAALRELPRAKMGLQLGYVDEKFLSLVDILESQGYLKIVMNPTIEVVNGEMAKVSSMQKVPLQQTYLRSGIASEWVESKMEYEDVVDSLQVTPHAFADNYVGLETNITLGSKLTPEGVKQLPIITKKEIQNKENRIRLGDSLVIGGIRKSEKRDVVRGIPFLKDIPLIGILFSGRDFEHRVVETIFILTPSISTGGIPKTEMIEDVKEKHELFKPGALEKTITDPLGFKAREKEQQRKADETEQARLEAEKERTEARNALREANLKVKNAEAEAEKARAELDQVRAEAEKTVADAEKTKAEAQAMIKAAEQAKAEAKKGNAEEGKAKAQQPTKQAKKSTG